MTYKIKDQEFQRVVYSGGSRLSEFRKIPEENFSKINDFFSDFCKCKKYRNQWQKFEHLKFQWPFSKVKNICYWKYTKNGKYKITPYQRLFSVIFISDFLTFLKSSWTNENSDYPLVVYILICSTFKKILHSSGSLLNFVFMTHTLWNLMGQK